MSAKKKLYCAVSDCNLQENVEKRHFFKFPKEYNRWLQWIRACGRSDLEPKGPEYASQNCRLCHVHFEEKWYNVNKIRARLHPDAVPTKFSGSTFDKNNAAISNMEEENADAIQVPSEIQHKEVQILGKTGQQKETIEKIEANMKIEERNRSSLAGSSILTIEAKKVVEDSPRKKKLRMKIKKLKAQNKSLRETVRRLRMEKKKRKENETRKATIEEEAEYETLRNLGNLHGNYSVANFEKQRTREADN